MADNNTKTIWHGLLKRGATTGTLYGKLLDGFGAAIELTCVMHPDGSYEIHGMPRDPADAHRRNPAT